MWSKILETVLGQNKPVSTPLPDFPEDKPDYSGAIAAAVLGLALVAVFFFLLKSK